MRIRPKNFVLGSRLFRPRTEPRDVALSFKDYNGTTGKVTETLDVEYNGKWKQDVEECVQIVENDTSPGHETSPSDDPYTRLVLELPEEAPIVEVEQNDPP